MLLEYVGLDPEAFKRHPKPRPRPRPRPRPVGLDPIAFKRYLIRNMLINSFETCWSRSFFLRDI